MKSLKLRNPFTRKSNRSAASVTVSDDDDSPEATVIRNLNELFDSRRNVYDESAVYLHSIVEAAASPEAARICAEQLQTYLAVDSKKTKSREGSRDAETKFAWRYYVITLIGILANNPGRTFTRHLGEEFTKTVQAFLEANLPYSYELDMMLMPKLDEFESQNSDPTNDRYDEGLIYLVDMWKKQKEGNNPRVGEYMKRKRRGPVPHEPTMRGPRLPNPDELARRLEEGRNSAKVLSDVITDTPPARLLEDDLVKEFVERCQRASRSIQGYMDCRDPTPDHETMETLIDTNEQLQGALNLHRRATLSARKNMDLTAPLDTSHMSADERQPATRASPPAAGLGIHTSSGSGSGNNETNGKGKGREYEPLSYAGSSAGPSRSHTPQVEDNPFQDPDETRGSWEAGGSSDRYHSQEPRLAFEPYHPGFESTASYVGRQESAIGKESMHGAVGSASSGGATGSRPQQHADVSDGDSDLYDPSSDKQKEPIYRY